MFFIDADNRSFHYRPPTKLCKGNEFSRICLLVSSSVQGGPMWPLPMMYWTSLYRNPPLALQLPTHAGSHQTRTPSPGPSFPLLVTSGGPDWRLVQTCSLDEPPGADIWWLLNHIPSTKQAIRILLECFLIQWEIRFPFVKLFRLPFICRGKR